MGVLFLDQYTLLHFATGVSAYFWGIPLQTFLILHTIFELLENTSYGMFIINTYIWFWPGGKPNSDSLINRLGDTLGALLGWSIAQYLDNYVKSNSL